MRIEEIAVMPWPELAGAAPTLMGSLFIPTGLEPLFADFGAEFTADTVQRYVLPLYRQLLTGIVPLGRNVIAMHFRAGDIITPPAGASIHGWYVQPPAAYYLAAFEHAQQHFGVDSVCLVFEDHANPAIDCVARALASRGVPCRLQSADVITDLKTLLGASHLVPSYGTFCEAIAVLSAHCETYYGFRRLSSAHDAEGFPQARVDQLLRVQGVRTLLIDDVHDRYTPAQQWTASREQLELITTFPQEFLELKEIPRG
jgi:hypothetical protein